MSQEGGPLTFIQRLKAGKGLPSASHVARTPPPSSTTPEDTTMTDAGPPDVKPRDNLAKSTPSSAVLSPVARDFKPPSYAGLGTSVSPVSLKKSSGPHRVGTGPHRALEPNLSLQEMPSGPSSPPASLASPAPSVPEKHRAGPHAHPHPAAAVSSSASRPATSEAGLENKSPHTVTKSVVPEASKAGSDNKVPHVATKTGLQEVSKKNVVTVKPQAQRNTDSEILSSTDIGRERLSNDLPPNAEFVAKAAAVTKVATHEILGHKTNKSVADGISVTKMKDGQNANNKQIKHNGEAFESSSTTVKSPNAENDKMAARGSSTDWLALFLGLQGLPEARPAIRAFLKNIETKLEQLDGATGTTSNGASVTQKTYAILLKLPSGQEYPASVSGSTTIEAVMEDAQKMIVGSNIKIVLDASSTN